MTDKSSRHSPTQNPLDLVFLLSAWKGDEKYQGEGGGKAYGMTDRVGRMEGIARIDPPGKDRQNKGPAGKQSKKRKINPATQRTGWGFQEAQPKKSGRG